VSLIAEENREEATGAICAVVLAPLCSVRATMVTNENGVSNSRPAIRGRGPGVTIL
jgi:hypothetical protein